MGHEHAMAQRCLRTPDLKQTSPTHPRLHANQTEWLIGTGTAEEHSEASENEQMAVPLSVTAFVLRSQVKCSCWC